MRTDCTGCFRQVSSTRICRLNYFELLGLSREPFSNSPDPAFFYESKSHAQCLHRLEIAIRLRRGLNVCMGEVGAGKSTLCRALIQQLDKDNTIVSHLILDPHFSTAQEFLASLHTRFLEEAPPVDASHWELTEAVKNHLFQNVLKNEKILVLIVDEGQKLSSECLEVLRELLNYETNDSKLLQVVVFAQNEFAAVLANLPNFQDRVNELCHLTPLGFKETKALIRHRLRLAGTTRKFFTWSAYWAMHRASRGHPRKIMHLGHKVLLSLIMNNRSKATRSMIAACAKAHSCKTGYKPHVLLILAACFFIFLTLLPKGLENDRANEPEKLSATGVNSAMRSFSEHRERIAGFSHPDLESTENKSTAKSTDVPDIAEQNQGSEGSSLAVTVTPLPDEAPKNPPSADTDSERVFPGSRFYIQVGGFQNRDNALLMFSSLREKYNLAGLIQIEYKGKQWFIVYIDHFEHPAQAMERAHFFKEREGMETVVVEVAGVRYRLVRKD